MAGRHRRGPAVDELPPVSAQPAPVPTQPAPVPVPAELASVSTALPPDSPAAAWPAPAAPATSDVPPPPAPPPPPAAVSLLPSSAAPSVGQGAATEAAPVLPGVASPTARRAVREQRRSRTRRNRLVSAGVVAVLVVALATGTFALLRNDGSTPPAAAPTTTRPQTTLLVEVLDSGRRTVDAVLLGHDSRDQGTGYGALVPSGLVVDVPGSGSASFGATTATVGASASAAALSDSLGVLVDGTWQLDQAGLAALVDSVGGVDVTVDRDVTAAGATGGAILVPSGAQHLAGAAAAQFATFLAPQEAEQARLARFSQVLDGVIGKLPADATAVGHLLASPTGVAGHSTSSFSPSHLAAMLASLRGDSVGDRMSYDTLPVRVLDTGNGAPQLLLDPTPAAALVSKNFSGAQPPRSAAGEVRVLVQNGVGTPGLSQKARTRLVAAGLTYVNGGNAGRFGYATSIVLILDGSQQSRLQGDQTAKALGLPAADVQITSQGQTVADVVVVLGKDFTG